MAHKKIFILLGNPDKETLGGALVDAYESEALESGYEVRRMNVGDMQFDPILHRGYKVIQELEPDLKTFQKNVAWADHIVIVYPNWWCTMPALLKGLFDRAWLPGFAFRFHKNKMGWDKLLRGKSARIVITAASSGLIGRFLFGDFTNELARGTLGFAGIDPVRITIFSFVERSTKEKCTHWIKKMKKMGKSAR
ncbi:NADPH:quinone reductase [Candidatus Kaiserbacteria bacterium CG10_big_fil_rev_8_21_14_0_10_45_20]|uniref:NADPH:quinone reductase n=1 Tax=Candidatus Kaiserbacteria bacterium CG10_big_fil_rev_8_21_14_0_10_45_20 TaxID=1974607 RepID=A0A2H0UGL3_9BACT|nr:MAG: NADPH:quinone reductase [Candidatus Kaiserbacteria bacterium CG10_big_fil_rev_8_21_14_0_10_45_20]